MKTSCLCFSFTTAIRSGFVYQGNENVTVGGGEEVWLFLNRILVLQVANDANDATMACKTVNIADAVYGGESGTTRQSVSQARSVTFVA